MKKLLVLALAVVLILSVTVVAYAATFDPYVGGRVQLSYISTDVEDPDDSLFGGATKDDPLTYGNSGLKLKIQGTVKDEDTGTWATIGVMASGWPDNVNDDGLNTSISGPHYDFGINNVGGSNLGIWFTNWENENMKRGQPQVYNILPNQYHDDPMFNQTLGYGLGFDYVTDSVKVNIGYDPNKNDNDANLVIASATFNFDGGDVHFGTMDNGDDTEMIVGGSFKLGFGSIKADYVAKDNEAGKDGNIIQAAVFFEDLGFDITVISDSKYKFATDGGIGYQIRYTGIDKVTFGYRAMEAEAKADEKGNFTDLFVGYKFGIFETRIGMGTIGESDNNDFMYVSAYASLW